ncbi:cache domain-containing protein [Rhodoblastus sp. 17X3]|uniref:cache domain-containing protein n=1 Tax=Rhodoblastus sp. 17X3 TaxID=3047026 RepID=UPI0024B63C38|nr:cache domain-containing protein [Rhodoblastus sp. 17X3]MDI9848506.1 cache domain-containing protein [Rhodoblastus sp. 17X3]
MGRLRDAPKSQDKSGKNAAASACATRKSQKNAQSRGNDMLRKIIIAAASGLVLALSSGAFAQQSDRSPDAYKARAMLLNVVAEVKINREQAFEMFNQGGGRFKDGDLYVFCTDAKNGKFVAMGNANAKELLGQDVRTLKDPSGKAFGQEIYDAGQKPEDEITEVSYVFVKPSDPKSAAKTSFVTKVDDDYACGVGYYK